MTEPGIVRFAATPVESTGTPESVWQPWLDDIPFTELAPLAEAVVVAPHPDDEVLGVGGIAAVLAACGTSVTIVAVTDGEKSHPAVPGMSSADLAHRRRLESDRAAAHLGLFVSHRLGYPDGSVTDHEDQLADRLTELLPSGSWCFAPWRGDGHPDHEATGRAAARAADRNHVTFVEYPIWMWHWATPGDAAVPWPSARRIGLPDWAVGAKRSAVAEFATQIREMPTHPGMPPILPPFVLERLVRGFETVFVR